MIWGLQGVTAPPCLRKFGILRAKYMHNFRPLVEKYMIAGGRKGADLLFLKECIFGKHNAQYSVPFLPKFIRIYDFGACKGAVSHFLSENSVFAS